MRYFELCEKSSLFAKEIIDSNEFQKLLSLKEEISKTIPELLENFQKAKEKYEKMVFFCEKYKMPYMVVDTSNLTPDQTVEIIMKRIEGRA